MEEPMRNLLVAVHCRLQAPEPTTNRGRKRAMKLPAIIFALALTGVAMPSVFAQTSDATVAVEGGNIQGVAADVAGITVYKAIPFAAPPVGSNRWKAPQPVVAWSGVRDSSTWPNRCYQLASANPPGTFY